MAAFPGDRLESQEHYEGLDLGAARKWLSIKSRSAQPFSWVGVTNELDEKLDTYKKWTFRATAASLFAPFLLGYPTIILPVFLSYVWGRAEDFRQNSTFLVNSNAEIDALRDDLKATIKSRLLRSIIPNGWSYLRIGAAAAFGAACAWGGQGIAEYERNKMVYEASLPRVDANQRVNSTYGEAARCDNKPEGGEKLYTLPNGQEVFVRCPPPAPARP